MFNAILSKYFSNLGTALSKSFILYTLWCYFSIMYFKVNIMGGKEVNAAEAVKFTKIENSMSIVVLAYALLEFVKSNEFDQALDNMDVRNIPIDEAQNDQAIDPNMPKYRLNN